MQEEKVSQKRENLRKKNEEIHITDVKLTTPIGTELDRKVRVTIRKIEPPGE